MNGLLRTTRCLYKFQYTTKNNTFNRQICAPSLLTNTYSTTKTKLKTDQTSGNDVNWRVIYKLPLVRLASAFNRLKVYQMGLTIVGVPGTQLLVSLYDVPQQTAFVVATIGLTGVLTLTLGSLALRNLVGYVYINREEDQLKLAFVDFWGRRKNTILPINDIVPGWEIPRGRFHFYYPIRTRTDKQQTYKLIQRYGIVTDATTFAHLFGD